MEEKGLDQIQFLRAASRPDRSKHFYLCMDDAHMYVCFWDKEKRKEKNFFLSFFLLDQQPCDIVCVQLVAAMLGIRMHCVIEKRVVFILGTYFPIVPE